MMYIIASLGILTLLVIIIFPIMMHYTFYKKFETQIKSANQLEKVIGKVKNVKEIIPNLPSSYGNENSITYKITTENGKRHKIKFIIKKNTTIIIGFEYRKKKIFIPSR